MTGQRRLAYRNLEKMIDAHGPVRFKLRELSTATANFSPARKLGHGGFGTVYLGYLQRMTMNIEVVVKRVSTTGNSNQGEQEFLAEVNTISKLSHRDLVKLIGWCHERGELLLVYEYFPMGSLDRHLYAGERSTGAFTPATTAAASPELTWDRRYKIICGVASALVYLHHGSSRRILHRDVKASNVMLDEEYNARLGDLGLARVIERDGVTHHSTKQAWPAPPHRQQQQPMYIVDWTWRLYGEGRAIHAADDAVLHNGAELDPPQVERAVRLALACSYPNPRERPSMRTAVQVLIGGAKAPEPPFHKPAFGKAPFGTDPDGSGSHL
ncbi:probable L-type lectin-domain containing receptor kinase S.5 [Miscanthus floridulus]|uniref:probable L-type lectin-domain containing receptor kinase S.5 n=1 Tax=Miscanthus floridulus TaxID=154761 RepID=UPI00345A9894